MGKSGNSAPVRLRLAFPPEVRVVEETVSGARVLMLGLLQQ